jgi:hypothetical protein
MNLTLQNKFDIILHALEIIGSYETCDCGCPQKRQGRVAGTPAQVWAIANEALRNIGHEIKVYDEKSSNY